MKKEFRQQNIGLNSPEYKRFTENLKFSVLLTLEMPFACGQYGKGPSELKVFTLWSD